MIFVEHCNITRMRNVCAETQSVCGKMFKFHGSFTCFKKVNLKSENGFDKSRYYGGTFGSGRDCIRVENTVIFAVYDTCRLNCFNGVANVFTKGSDVAEFISIGDVFECVVIIFHVICNIKCHIATGNRLFRHKIVVFAFGNTDLRSPFYVGRIIFRWVYIRKIRRT